MSNNLLTNPTGIDVEIKDIQTDLYDALIARWVDDIEGFGRVYKVEDENGIFVARIYKGDGEYLPDVYTDDNSSGRFFFIVGDTDSSEDEFLFTTPVKCVFMVDLKKILSSDAERLDSEAQRDAVEILRAYSPRIFKITGIERGLENVLTGFGQDKIKTSDNHPYHTFSVNFTLSYHINDKCV